MRNLRRVLASAFAIIAAIAWQLADALCPPQITQHHSAETARLIRDLQQGRRATVRPMYDPDDTQPMARADDNGHGLG